MPVHIGTSGWAYRHWQGGFYPSGLKAGAQLAHYVQHFDAVEINGTAYRTPTPGSVRHWSETMPAGFIAAVKLSHGITHYRRLRACEALFERFIASVQHLADNRGPVLAQLPPAFAPDHARLRDFLAMARSLMADDRWPLVIEFRHPQWLSEGTERLLGDAHASWCLSDMPGCPVDRPSAGAPVLYVRRHGIDGRYHGSYDEQVLQRDAELLCAWESRGLPAYAFFNNDIGGAAVDDARRLQGLVAARRGRSEPGAPGSPPDQRT